MVPFGRRVAITRAFAGWMACESISDPHGTNRELEVIDEAGRSCHKPSPRNLILATRRGNLQTEASNKIFLTAICAHSCSFTQWRMHSTLLDLTDELASNLHCLATFVARIFLLMLPRVPAARDRIGLRHLTRCASPGSGRFASASFCRHLQLLVRLRPLGPGASRTVTLCMGFSV